MDKAWVNLQVPADLFARLYQREKDGKGSVGQMIVDALEAAYPAGQSAPEAAQPEEAPADVPAEEAQPDAQPEDAPATE